MEERLTHYRRLRDFAATTEPEGGTPESAARGGAPRFVIQQHDATRLHWDLRLEREGVLASWALPRGLPWRPKENRLAVLTEDHPLEYLDFHGEIPAGQYGAGTMTIWDRGTYEAGTFTDDKVVVVLHGERVEGTYALFPIGGRDWMIHRMDPPQDPDREPLPDDLRPMIGLPGALPPDGEAWAFEVLWPGVRVLVTNDAGRVT
ncbi:MAG: ATP-dependent DNA ligase, partial [Actinomycetota bacterium]|nr:ATP-dependent DNA ligase [Actinomycetota bacterium]